jgi:nucleotide-binding universal stress UspA family protein
MYEPSRSPCRRASSPAAPSGRAQGPDRAGRPAAIGPRRAPAEARRRADRVQEVSCWEFPLYYGWPAGLPYEDFAGLAGKTLSEAVQEAVGFDEPAVEVLETVAAGHPAQVLIDASAHAALLAVGSRGHGGFAGTLLGSVSQHCAQRCHCPVVIVRGAS